MTDKNRMSLEELFAKRRAEQAAEREAQLAWEKTPEGSAWRKQQDEHHRRMAEADERWAAEHPISEDSEEDDAEDGSEEE